MAGMSLPGMIIIIFNLTVRCNKGIRKLIPQINQHAKPIGAGVGMLIHIAEETAAFFGYFPGIFDIDHRHPFINPAFTAESLFGIKVSDIFGFGRRGQRPVWRRTFALHYLLRIADVGKAAAPALSQFSDQGYFVVTSERLQIKADNILQIHNIIVHQHQIIFIRMVQGILIADIFAVMGICG